jgi:hypothetical protein
MSKTSKISFEAHDTVFSERSSFQVEAKASTNVSYSTFNTVEKSYSSEMMTFEKSIGLYASIALLSNNISGPAMMSLPLLVQRAGILPVIFGLVLVSVCSSLNATILADTISMLPGNIFFGRTISFARAFHLIAGGYWYVIAETLFLMLCFVQTCASIVDTAQALDEFFASFIFGSSYALQLYPLEFITWTPSLCDTDCLPFNNAGQYVITLGYALTTAVFLPISLGHLKDTLWVQFMAFFALLIIIIIFVIEFIHQGFPNISHLKLFGEDYSQLTGVILFNYAFTVTIPSWLNEKRKDVDVTTVVWTCTSLNTAIYIIFSVMAAMTFSDAGSNVLEVLGSGKVVTLPSSRSFTRVRLLLIL